MLFGLNYGSFMELSYFENRKMEAALEVSILELYDIAK